MLKFKKIQIIIISLLFLAQFLIQSKAQKQINNTEKSKSSSNRQQQKQSPKEELPTQPVQNTIKEEKLCPKGQYLDIEKKVCLYCNDGEYKEIEGNEKCKNCQKGYSCFYRDQLQEKCAKGEYSDKEKQLECIPCKDGEYNENEGESKCKNCPKGKSCFWKNEAPTDCPAGTYQDLENQTECKPCKDGEYNDQVGQTKCKDCPEGSYCFRNDMAPISCPTGTYQDKKYQNECHECRDGEYNDQTGQTKCINCPAGNYCLWKNILPIPCPIATYQDKPNQIECIQCPQGQYNEQEGQIACKECPKGNKCEWKTDVPVPYGQYSINQDNIECIKCPIGNYCPYVDESPRKCPKGTFQDELGKSICKTCPDGQFNIQEGSQVCQECSAGNFCQFKDLQSVKCPKGFFSNIKNSVSCQPCGVGEFNVSEGKTKCIECSPGSFCPYKDILPIECFPGTYQDSSKQISCKQCEDGQYQDKRGQTKCEQCKNKAFCVKDQAPVATCDEGQYIDPKTGKCVYCQQGFYLQIDPNSKNASCTLCPRGKSCFYASQPFDCPENTYAQEGQSRCYNCPEGLFCPVGDIQPLYVYKNFDKNKIFSYFLILKNKYNVQQIQENDSQQFFQKDGIYGTIFYQNQSIFVTFRYQGRDSYYQWTYDLNEDQSDSDVCVGYCQVHKIWHGYYQVIKPDFLNKMKTIMSLYPSASQINFIGANIGAAVATLAAAEYSKQYQNKINLYTFGSPRVGNEAFVSFVNGQIKGENFRMTHKDDVATTIPSRLKFRHVGQEIYTANNEDFYVVPLGIDGEYTRSGNNFHSYYNSMFEKPIKDAEKDVYGGILLINLIFLAVYLV
ncbi:mastigoneme-like protein, putative [Ichthyophthirius multifiliis]|uniref:Mastigoneme-like protein, putative n=1 Tax=Ichthyophthirius multifiliis TaxID=5932 RepID=G0QMC8_ICHMU|nr:mastigoneme-like protein, putative [Ichthyophthirius multifiliis]EGR33622.1 mastigoneme-like protein, putative [Ichthyophthirius multifiliis]|eukprot:XP_004037608.1 mastigoneme-like protein, putative [Ichthyophthirius multifiliis]